MLFPFNTDTFRSIRELMIRLILATDMKSHFEKFSRYKLRRASTDFNYLTNLDDLKLVLELCIKIGDLSASACSWDIHLEWCYRVTEEFYRQGEEELQRSLPLSSLCDRSKHHAEFTKAQIGFINFVTLPLFELVVSLRQENEQLTQLITEIEQNQENWKNLDAELVTIPKHIVQCGSRHLHPNVSPLFCPL